MSHSQFHSTKLFILRHAWLNLWDKHMTTGRINQVTSLKKEKIASSRNRTQEERATVNRLSFLFFRRQSFQENVAIPPKRPGQEVVSSLICLCETCTTNAWRHGECLLHRHFSQISCCQSLIFFPSTEHWKIQFFKAGTSVEVPFK